MSDVVRCPECNAALRVPDQFDGGEVQCAGCRGAFVATLPEPPPPEPVVAETTTLRLTQLDVSPAASDQSEMDQPRRARPLDERENYNVNDEFDWNPLQAGKRDKLPKHVRSRISRPVHAITTVIVLNLALGIVVLAYALFSLSSSWWQTGRFASGQGNQWRVVKQNPNQRRGPARWRRRPTPVRPIQPALYLPSSAAAAFWIVWSALILYGMHCMYHFKGYAFSLIACVMIMVPVASACFVLGIPFGLWGLYALTGREVRAAFRTR